MGQLAKYLPALLKILATNPEAITEALGIVAEGTELAKRIVAFAQKYPALVGEIEKAIGAGA